MRRKLSLAEQVNHSKDVFQEMIEKDFVLRDGEVLLPPDMFIDLLNNRARDLQCKSTKKDNRVGYVYNAVYNNTPIKTITENKIYEVKV